MKLIDADKLLLEWTDHFDSMYSEECANMFKKAVNSAPAVDARPVIHAHYKRHTSKEKTNNKEKK